MRATSYLSVFLLLVVFPACSPQSRHRAFRLKLIDETLCQNNASALKRNEGLVIQAEEYVARIRYRKSEIPLLERSVEIHQKLISVISLLHRVREQLLLASEGNGPADKLLDDEAPSRLLTQAASASAIDSIYTRLHLFTREILPSMYEAKQRPISASSASAEAWPFTLGATVSEYRNMYWKGTSTAESLAALAQQESQLIGLADLALNKQLIKLQSSLDCFSRSGAMEAHAIPESNSVEEGATYRAKLFFALPAKGEAVRMSVNDKPIEIDKEGYGQVEFVAKAPAGSTRKNVTMYWEGAVITAHQGYLTTYPIRVPYTVRRR